MGFWAGFAFGVFVVLLGAAVAFAVFAAVLTKRVDGVTWF